VMLSATGLSRAAMPRLVESNSPAGTLQPELTARWHMMLRPVLQQGRGTMPQARWDCRRSRPGDAFVSLGTSGVLFAATDRFRPWPQAALHAFCHALPGALAPDGGYPVGGGLARMVGAARHRSLRGGLADRSRVAGVSKPQHYSCPIWAVNGRRLTTVRSAAPSLGCRTTRIGAC